MHGYVFRGLWFYAMYDICNDVLDFISDAFYIDLTYDYVLLFVLNVVYEWVGGWCLFVDVLLFIGCYVGGVWCCCCELFECVNGAVGVYCLCFICMYFWWTQCVWLHLIEVVLVYWCVTKVTHPNDWSVWWCVFVCVVGNQGWRWVIRDGIYTIE